jgi:hypothetical protein
MAIILFHVFFSFTASALAREGFALGNASATTVTMTLLMQKNEWLPRDTFFSAIQALFPRKFKKMGTMLVLLLLPLAKQYDYLPHCLFLFAV